MSLYGVLRTGVSGMMAQASKLGTTADNIANANTTGYKRAGVEFSSLVLQSGGSAYNSGGVTSGVRYAISDQGSLQYTTSKTDLAVTGNGFFVVSDKNGAPFLTRAGAFVPNGNGNLVNAAGYTLMGYPLDQGAPNVVANGLAGMQPVNVSAMALEATPSTEGRFSVNLPSNAAVIPPADLPSANATTAQFTAKSSLVGYDNLGNEVYLDVYYAKTASEEWEVTVYDRAQAAAGGGFPYGAGPLTTDTLLFDPSTGELTAGSPSSLTLTVPNGAPLDLDLTGTMQLAADYMVMTAEVNGNAPSAVSGIQIDDEGTVFAMLENGTRRAAFQIPLADVISPDKLNPLAGNVYVPTTESGDVQVGMPGEAGFGRVTSGALEQSNVDIASELVSMIESQRGYTANSKVFQTGSELLDVLINLKR